MSSRIHWLIDWLYPRTKDHCGKLVPLAWIDGVAVFNPGARKLPADLYQQVRRDLFRQYRVGAYAISIGAGIIAGIGVLPGMIMTRQYGFGVFGMLGMASLSSVACSLPMLFGVFLPISRRLYAKRLVDIVLKRNHCPSCGYALHQIGDMQEPHVTCPECGATWRRKSMESTG